MFEDALEEYHESYYAKSAESNIRNILGEKTVFLSINDDAEDSQFSSDDEDQVNEIIVPQNNFDKNILFKDYPTVEDYLYQYLVCQNVLDVKKKQHQPKYIQFKCKVNGCRFKAKLCKIEINNWKFKRS